MDPNEECVQQKKRSKYDDYDDDLSISEEPPRPEKHRVKEGKAKNGDDPEAAMHPTQSVNRRRTPHSKKDYPGTILRLRTEYSLTVL